MPVTQHQEVETGRSQGLTGQDVFLKPQISDLVRFCLKNQDGEMMKENILIATSFPSRVCVCVPAHIFTHVYTTSIPPLSHTHIHTHTHTHTHTHILPTYFPHIHTLSHTYTHSHTYSKTHTHTSHTLSHMYTYTHPYTLTQSHTLSHTHTHTCTHSHTHTHTSYTSITNSHLL